MNLYLVFYFRIALLKMRDIGKPYSFILLPDPPFVNSYTIKFSGDVTKISLEKSASFDRLSKSQRKPRRGAQKNHTRILAHHMSPFFLCHAPSCGNSRLWQGQSSHKNTLTRRENGGMITQVWRVCHYFAIILVIFDSRPVWNVNRWCHLGGIWKVNWVRSPNCPSNREADETPPNPLGLAQVTVEIFPWEGGGLGRSQVGRTACLPHLKLPLSSFQR